MIDIIYVSYNSEKWFAGCFDSLSKVEFDKKQLNIYVVDNCSTDQSVASLNTIKNEIGGIFGSFHIIQEQKNWGFGKANNIGFQKGSSDIVCFLNIDTEVFPDTFNELMKEVKSSEKDVAVWEFRQFPYEHPKMYDILTGETTWVSGAAFAIRRSVYEEIGGFDKKIFMYAEDVDLSWRIRANGYLLRYCPRVRITHYAYTSAGELKPNQYIYSIINNLMLRFRYGSIRDILKGQAKFWHLILCRPPAFRGSKKALLKSYFVSIKNVMHFWGWGKYRKNKLVANFLGWDYSIIRDGAFYQNHEMKEKPLVSILVRTCGRPSVLRETLISLQKQTYDNIEVVVVEDGAPCAKDMIQKEFGNMNIIYHALGENKGRSRAGNIAMEMANGKYLNFLDDDDLFFADHVEVLVNTILESHNRAAYATSYETPISIKSKDPYLYTIKTYRGVHKQEFNRMILCHHNYIPIQCVLFEKSLFEQYGGLDESVDALEDWDMWLRYALENDFTFLFKTTSVYRVPAETQINAKRQKALDDALAIMREKHKNYVAKISAYDISQLIK